MSIEKKLFGKMPDGAEIDLVTLKNEHNVSAEIMNYGCRVVRLWVPDKNGKIEDVILGHDTLEEYLSYTNYQGAVVGRYGNRIANGKFAIDGVSYQLTINEGKNQLHGGDGYSQKVWKIENIRDGKEPSVTFTYKSMDGEEGFPGELNVSVTYTITENNALNIDYKAVGNKKTVVNLTNHTFFNIGGYENGDILNQELTINADHYTPTEKDLIPTGEILPVAGTAIDFTKAKAVGKDIGATEILMDMIQGYDHNFVLNRKGNGLEKAAEVYDPKSGRLMEVYTDLPGIQLYTANSFPEGLKGKNGVLMKSHCALCLETQYYPDSPNHANFPSCILNPGDTYHHVTEYRFSVK